MKLSKKDFNFIKESKLNEIIKEINEEKHEEYTGYAFYEELEEFQYELDNGYIRDDGQLIMTDNEFGILLF